MGQNGFDRACVSVVFLFLLCFIAHSYEANGGRTWKYWPASGPFFFFRYAFHVLYKFPFLFRESAKRLAYAKKFFFSFSTHL